MKSLAFSLHSWWKVKNRDSGFGAGVIKALWTLRRGSCLEAASFSLVVHEITYPTTMLLSGFWMFSNFSNLN